MGLLGVCHGGRRSAARFGSDQLRADTGAAESAERPHRCRRRPIGTPGGAPSAGIAGPESYAATSPARLNGRRRTFGPPRRATAFATAGASGGTPGSPTPLGSAVLGTM